MAETTYTLPTTVPANTISPEINYNVHAYLNTTPTAETPTWSDMGGVIKNISKSLNEVLYQAAYYGSRGWSSTEVTGGQLTVTMTGDVKPGDAVSDFLTKPEVQYDFGSARKTHMLIARGAEALIWPVTLANITDAMGDANQPNSLTVTIHGNGAPTFSTMSAKE